MAFVPFTNVAQVELFYRQDNQRVENVLNFRMTAAPTVASLNSLAGNVITWWDTVVKPIATLTVSLVGVKATSLQSQTAPAVENVTGLPIAGTLAGAGSPNNVTVVIKFVTASRGRSFRGRVYHVGLLNSQLSVNTVSAGTRTALTSAYSALLVPAAFGGAELVVASRFSNNVQRALGVATTVTGVTVNPTLDSQRRRLPERGL
jgi:hypothetical protein